MITKEVFCTVIKQVQLSDDYVKKAEELDIYLSDTKLYNHSSYLLQILLELSFDTEAVDVIYWWLYEYDDKTKPSMWDKVGNEIPMHTIEDLWKYVKDHRI